MLYRVSFNTYGASYTRCFTDKQEAEKFYNSIKDSCSYNNVNFQEGWYICCAIGYTGREELA